MIEGHSARILFDNGSSSHYISEQFLKTYGLMSKEVSLKTPIPISMVNGSKTMIRAFVKLSLKIGKYEEIVSFYVMPLNNHNDIILGKPWFNENKPKVDWPRNEMTIRQNGNEIGIPEKKEPESTERSFNMKRLWLHQIGVLRTRS
jgi:hypothetical protein